MLVIDTFLEWFIIFLGVLMAVAVIWPRLFEPVVKTLCKAIPEPAAVAKWLRDHGM